jgi:hypothetical protein
VLDRSYDGARAAKLLEDALVGRLAQQIHERTIDARDLIGRMRRCVTPAA